MSQTGLPELETLTGLLPSPSAIMTAAYAGQRAGVKVRAVQIAAAEPLLLAISLRRGHWIEPLIRDAHTFALCMISPAERLLAKTFCDESEQHDHDPFDAIETVPLPSGSPALARCDLAIDCEVVRHFDLEADCGLYIGQVLAVRDMRTA